MKSCCPPSLPRTRWSRWLAGLLLSLSGTSQALPVPIQPEDAAIPGISPAMLAPDGPLLFLSGHLPIRDDGQIPASLEAQLQLAFENLMATLRQAGAGPEHLLRLTLYIRDYQPHELQQIRQVRDRFIVASRPPASALIGVSALFHPQVRVEVDAIAALPASARSRHRH